MTVREIESQIKKLAPDQRAALAKSIVSSLDDLSEAEVAMLWAKEGERRLHQMERGTVREIPAAAALRRARAAIAR